MSRTASRRRGTDAGFTLIELMVVVLVVAVLVGISATTMLRARHRAQDAAATTALRTTVGTAAATGSVLTTTPALLAAAEPSLSFVTGPSTGPRVVSVAVTPTALYAAALSASGTCFLAAQDESTWSYTEAAGTCDATSLSASGYLPSGWTTTVPTTTGTTTTPSSTTTAAPSTTTTTPTAPACTGTTVAVCVTSSTGSGVSGVAIAYVWNGSWVNAGTTDTAGGLTASLPSGTYTVRATYAGGSQETTRTVTAGVPIAISTTPVTVRVATSTGTPIPGATINYYGNQWAWQTDRTTGPDGTVTYELLPGWYTLRATTAGASQELTTQTVTTTPTTFTFTTTPVTVQVLTPGGAGIAGATVSYYGNQWSWQPNRTTGPGGTLAYELLPGWYTVQASASGVSKQASMTVGATPSSVTVTVP